MESFDGVGMVPPPGAPSGIPPVGMAIPTSLAAPPAALSPFAHSPFGTPPVSQSPFGMQTTNIPAPAVVGMPQMHSGISTPPVMGLQHMNVPGMLEGTYQADQTGPVYPGPGATKEKTVFKLCKTSSSQSDQINRAKKYAMEQSIKTVLVKQTIAHQAQQQLNFQSNVQKQQALALMCRIYVGSINFEIKEDTIKQAFQPFGPIKSVNLSWDSVTNKHKGFAFVEYDIPEAASLAMEQMNGVMIGGRNIKVGRPTNMPQAQPIIEQLKEDAKTFNRIYVSSVHPDLVMSDVKSVFEAFGAIKLCQLVPEPTRPGKHKGYGFIEYANNQSAEDAVASMNLFDLGGMFLRVGRAITPPDVIVAPTMVTTAPINTLPTASAIAAAAVTAKLTALEAQQPIKVERPPSAVVSEPQMAAIPPPGLATTVPPIGLATPTLGPAPPVAVPPVGMAVPTLSTLPTEPFAGSPVPPPSAAEPPKPTKEDNTIGAQENLKISGRDARHMVMQKLMRDSDEGRVCVLRNMVGPEDLDEELQHEVEEECSRYGNVQRVIIYQERQGEEADAEVIVKIFVEFTNQAEVERATSSLNGRYFGGRIVKAEKYSQDLYQASDFSG